MQATEWRDLVAKLNASYPGQEISPETAAEWYLELADRNAGDVWLAIRELRTEQTWRPSLAELLAGVKTYRARLAEQAHHQHLRELAGRKGAPMPPETKQAMEILADSVSGKVGKSEAKQMIDALADRLVERLEREQLMTLETG
jgi:hypothetical protein